MKYQIMNVDGRTVIVDNDEFIKSGDYSAVPLSLDVVCHLMNDKELKKEKIGAVILFIKEEHQAYSDEEGDDIFTNELIERLEDLK